MALMAQRCDTLGITRPWERSPEEQQEFLRRTVDVTKVGGREKWGG